MSAGPGTDKLTFGAFVETWLAGKKRTLAPVRGESIALFEINTASMSLARSFDSGDPPEGRDGVPVQEFAVALVRPRPGDRTGGSGRHHRRRPG